ncbi:MAG: hypothetical protein FWC89_09655, partial [Defluviitaleaceae bacterium]|nr:hypothetical protein [Defluviitaleaceae bacterium]
GNTWRDRIGDFQFTVLQPVIHGEGGIWYAGQFADRNMTYFINLQREFDAGYAPWRTDPVEVVRVYLEEHFAGRDLRLEGSMGNIRRRGEPSEFFDVIREIPAFARPDTTPLERFRSNPPFPRLLHDATATAMNLGMWWGWRDGILEELGGLAFNEAYQFNCDYGLYYVITGWRHLETAEELARYFPQWNLPQYVGDFQLVGISVNDGLLDNLRVYHGPLYQPFAWSSNTPIYGLSTEPSPTGEVFIHDQIGFAFFAMYANESGDYVGLGVSSPIFELHETWLIDDVPFSAMEYGGGEILLRRQAGEYFLAVHDTLDITNLETPWVYVSLTVHHSPELPHRYFGYNTWNEQRDNFSQLKRVPREQLEELVRIFNPVEMFAQYQWFAHGWQ